MNLSSIDLLIIGDQETRRKNFEWVTENSEGHQEVSANAYMELARKNQTEY